MKNNPLQGAIEELLSVTDWQVHGERLCLSATVVAQVVNARLRLQIASQQPRKHIPLVFVLGATNAGKSTLMDSVRSYPRIGTVEVGKMMRAKYPPEYFKGNASPAHTNDEGIRMGLDGIIAEEAAWKDICFIDGQPRTLKQVDAFCALPNPKSFLHLWAPDSVRRERAIARDGHDAVKLGLSLERLHGDAPALLDVLSVLLAGGERVTTWRTDRDEYSPWGAANAAANLHGVAL